MIKAFLLALVFAVGLAGAAVAGPYEDGGAAYHRSDYATAMRLWRPLADQGNADAQTNLGDMYGDGEGVPQDGPQAVAWYRKAADQGYARAQHNLGVMYAFGMGVPQDYAQALAWYRKAADQGYALAQSKLGFMYERGQGVPQDYIQAHMWLNLAASRYDPTDRADAVKQRDLVAAKMTPTQIAEAQRLASQWVAAHP